jgi:putative acetyltransferase
MTVDSAETFPHVASIMRATHHARMIELAFTLRPYTAEDEDAAIDLWRRTWELVYPAIDFAQRLEWWRQRWRNELVPSAKIVVAEADDNMVGFVTVDPVTLELDQIVVAAEAWGSGVALALLREAKRLSPRGLDLYVNQDNFRAVRFYEKHGFSVSGEALNWRSGSPVHKMSWRP